ncbi:MerR family transcriptional regulator [Enterococcus sp. BWT-B8]|uniref:MerR family transcriptional regulator n=1 Tax=Enterococcus sp. BWT-B8 TaxID=2885157 RepID=UPI001E3801E7|nr:MerR family transcriptional regulator [Enterococcus sp. BWT-B8]MCB5951763.1 MerR family transcriptional regulator [Enterococcus sp. BWT-B8]
MKKFLSIGEMAELCGISIQRLRYYSNIGLVEPIYVNQENNYRYYGINQKQTIFLIQTLQYLGLDLKDISGFISDQQSTDHTAEKIAEYIRREEEKLTRIQLITSILFEKKDSTKLPEFFSTLEFECQDETTVFDYGDEWMAAAKFFRKELLKRNLSLSYLFFCGVKFQQVDDRKKYFYYMELPGVFSDALNEERYEDYDLFFSQAESPSKLLHSSQTVYILRLPESVSKSNYRVLQLKQ